MGRFYPETYFRRTVQRSVSGGWAIVLAVLVLFCPAPSNAAEGLTIAVAANFISPFKEIAAAFDSKNKIKIEATFASTGSLYAQIINGAPYDAFLSADEEKPETLFTKGLSDMPFIYAVGKVVLWGSQKDFCTAKN